MNALEDLLEEHIIIVRAVNLLTSYANKMENGKGMAPEFFEKIFDVLTNFVDKCHHGKEEEVLFPLIKETSVKDADTVSLLLEEHENGRAFVRAMREAVNKKDSTGTIQNIRGYTMLLIQHIKKENLIFPTWISPLSDRTKKEMLDKFDRIETAAIGPKKRQEYFKTIEEIRKSI